MVGRGRERKQKHASHCATTRSQGHPRHVSKQRTAKLRPPAEKTEQSDRFSSEHWAVGGVIRQVLGSQIFVTGSHATKLRMRVHQMLNTRYPTPHAKRASHDTPATAGPTAHGPTAHGPQAMYMAWVHFATPTLAGVWCRARFAWVVGYLDISVRRTCVPSFVPWRPVTNICDLKTCRMGPPTAQCSEGKSVGLLVFRRGGPRFAVRCFLT
jgi:hypothetical protein